MPPKQQQIQRYLHKSMQRETCLPQVRSGFKVRFYTQALFAAVWACNGVKQNGFVVHAGMSLNGARQILCGIAQLHCCEVTDPNYGIYVLRAHMQRSTVQKIHRCKLSIIPSRPPLLVLASTTLWTMFAYLTAIVIVMNPPIDQPRMSG